MRSRTRSTLALAATIAIGLASRSGHNLVPGFLQAHAGDALWTVAVCWTLAWIRPKARSIVIAGIALGLSFAVESGQLWHPSWLEDLRATTPGAMLLGSGWDALDLLRYSVGALLAATIDATGILRAATPKP